MVEKKRLMTRLRPGAIGMTNRFSDVKPPCNQEDGMSSVGMPRPEQHCTSVVTLALSFARVD